MRQLRSNELSRARERRERTGADVVRVAPWMRVIAHSQSLPTLVMVLGCPLPQRRTAAAAHVLIHHVGSLPACAVRRTRDRVSRPAVMPRAQTGQLKTAYLALGLRASEFIDGRLCLFRRVEHGSEPAGHL